MDRYIFVAHFTYGASNLAKVKVAKETPKTFTVESHETLMGHIYVGKRVLKSSNWFNGGPAAIVWLIRKARGHIEMCEVNLERAKERLIELESAMPES